MKVLILKNVLNEGPGTIGDYLRENSISFRTVDCASEEIPPGNAFDTLVMMGGPMSVNETGIFPYLQKEIDTAAEFMKSGKKVLGVCLGAQIMAKALGAPVYARPEKEIGWYDIELQDAGLRDAVMIQVAMHSHEGAFKKKFKVFHWHGETFDIPEGAERLARSALYPNQAFRYGSVAYAFQFHLEVTEEMIYDWLRNEVIDRDMLKKETELFYQDYAARARSFYMAFFK